MIEDCSWRKRSKTWNSTRWWRRTTDWISSFRRSELMITNQSMKQSQRLCLSRKFQCKRSNLSMISSFRFERLQLVASCSTTHGLRHFVWRAKVSTLRLEPASSSLKNKMKKLKIAQTWYRYYRVWNRTKTGKWGNMQNEGSLWSYYRNRMSTASRIPHAEGKTPSSRCFITTKRPNNRVTDSFRYLHVIESVTIHLRSGIAAAKKTATSVGLKRLRPTIKCSRCRKSSRSTRIIVL